MQTDMSRVTFATPLGRCALAWHDAGLTGFELPEAAARASDETAPPAEIAAALGQSLGAARAVGTALGANRWPLLIPCHRVVAADGKMTGFSGPGGIRTKLRLLALEGAQLFAE